MEKYIINKREYQEVERDAKEGDKVVSKVNFTGGLTQEEDIVEVDSVYINKTNHQINFHDGKGMWCFTSKDQYCVVEPTNKPISNEDEILLLENDLANAYEEIDKLKKAFIELHELVDTLFERTEPLVKLSALFNISE